MPTNQKILGFSNRWYAAALRHAHQLAINDLPLRVVTAPYFVATKLEAFRGRGGGDFYASRDLEDIIAIVDGRASLLDEVKQVPSALRAYIAREIGKLLATREFVEALPGHLPGDSASQARIPALLRTLESLSALRSQSRKRSTHSRSKTHRR
jgi:hypothetical protein